mmetsp:Transcript_69863/g.221351  ORF Transcript_69863/g.221351 Transcript_69863/m.221351 type:complete len:201 (+) Transcript_69863:1085-1687(+)
MSSCPARCMPSLLATVLDTFIAPAKLMNPPVSRSSALPTPTPPNLLLPAAGGALLSHVSAFCARMRAAFLATWASRALAIASSMRAASSASAPPPLPSLAAKSISSSPMDDKAPLIASSGSSSRLACPPPDASATSSPAAALSSAALGVAPGSPDGGLTTLPPTFRSGTALPLSSCVLPPSGTTPPTGSSSLSSSSSPSM